MIDKHSKSLKFSLPNYIFLALICLTFIYRSHWASGIEFFRFTVPVYTFFVAFFLFVFFKKSKGMDLIIPLSAVILLAFICVLHALMIGINYSGFDFQKMLRAFLFIMSFIVLGYYFSLCNQFQLENKFIYAFFIIFLIGLILFFLDKSIVSIFDYGVWRLKMFMGEPSALAAPTVALIIASFMERKVIMLSVGVAVLFLSHSMVAVVVLVLSVFTILLVSRRAIVVGYVLAGLIFIFVLLSFFPELLLRVVKLIDAISRSSSLYEILVNSNIRTRNFAETYIEMMNRGDYFGYGLNQYGPLLNDPDFRPFSLAHWFFLGFGIVGGVVFLTCTLFIFKSLLAKRVFWLIPFVIAAVVNSSQGLILQGYWFIGLGYALHLIAARERLECK